jgi:hypothetical protein
LEKKYSKTLEHRMEMNEIMEREREREREVGNQVA